MNSNCVSVAAICMCVATAAFVQHRADSLEREMLERMLKTTNLTKVMGDNQTITTDNLEALHRRVKRLEDAFNAAPNNKARIVPLMDLNNVKFDAPERIFKERLP